MTRTRIAVALVLIAGSLAWVAAKGLGGALTYYKTPTEVLGQGAGAVGEQVRLGGFVVKGSVKQRGGDVDFVMSDGTSRLPVVATGGVPSLFAGGRGAVVEGAMSSSGVFRADAVLVKHSSVYKPPAPGSTPHYADLGG